MSNEQTLKECSDLISTLYKDREHYTIVALTGYTGTGCSVLADLMCKKFKEWTGLRKPEDLVIKTPVSVDNQDLMVGGMANHGNIASTVFTRKYTICYNFAKENYKRFKLLKYSHALMFLTFGATVEKARKGGKVINGQTLEDGLKEILKEKYRPSRKEDDEDYRSARNMNPANSSYHYDTEGKGNYAWEQVHTLGGFAFSDWDKLAKAFDSLQTGNISNKDLAELFFGLKDKVFVDFMENFSKYLWTNDCYCTDFFYHRLGAVIRATGNPYDITHSVMHSGTLYGKHLYDVVEFINNLIKGYRHSPKSDESESGACRIVIDKIRNSLEAKYLKERYSAFYFVATHEEKEVRNHLKARIQKTYPDQADIDAAKDLIDLQIRKIVELDAIEREGKDFDNGRFFAPNLSQCVADAEIHISNEDDQGGDRAVFFSMSEQWMKYASLIQHPALITPSSEERCMVVAYTAKFNSGCISRQVGAVITNKAHTIRTIGWNDVPYGQVPCSLREVPTMAIGLGDVQKVRRFVYSAYETDSVRKIKDGKTFNQLSRIKYRTLHLGIPQNQLMKGMSYPYCFKSLQNEFEGEKNQVHTRSLHAEENAMLQMAKYGGEGLHEGIIYVTASPCELCSKKLYQIGVRKIVYIDEYPGIARENIIASGYHRPRLKQFQGAYGATYFKLYQPILPYKEELAIRLGTINEPKPLSIKDSNIKKLSEILDLNLENNSYTEEELIRNIEEFKKFVNVDRVVDEHPTSKSDVPQANENEQMK